MAGELGILEEARPCLANHVIKSRLRVCVEAPAAFRMCACSHEYVGPLVSRCLVAWTMGDVQIDIGTCGR